MKQPANIQKLLVCTASAALAITALTAYSGNKPSDKPDKGGKHGKDIFHLSIQARMVNQGVVANAGGDAGIDWHEQGKANHQNLQVKVRGLDADTSYELAAQVNDDTNLTDVVTFTTDHEGEASVKLEDKGDGHAHHGHGKGQLPAELEPVSQISELVVLDSGGTNVSLTADFTALHHFQLLVKRDISSDTVDAELEIKAEQKKADVRLSAAGLVAGSDYTLMLNDTAVQTGTADEHGRLNLHTKLASSVDILSVSSVSLIDTDTNVVVSTTLP
jgi:hypothetical protein